MDHRNLQDFLILFGSLIAFLIGLTQVILAKKNQRNVLITAVFFDIALYQLTGNSFVFRDFHNWHTIFPLLNTIACAAIYALLPLVYLWLKSLTESDFRLSRRLLGHFLPMVLAILILVLFGERVSNPSIQPDEYRGYLYDTSLAYRLVALGTWIQTVVYASLLILDYRASMKKANPTKRRNLLSAAMVIFMMAFSTVVCMGYYFARDAFALIYPIRMTLFVTTVFLVSYRFPFVLNIVKLEAYRDGYVSPRVAHQDSFLMEERIEIMMSREQLFRDGELTLKKMARKLGISPHQLSEILNTRLGKSFPQYLKEKRVEAAKRAIAADPEKRIIEIAVDCGFNSLSVFNAAFKSVMRMTPTLFKKSLQPETEVMAEMRLS